jgi:dihydropyrimidinase
MKTLIKNGRLVLEDRLEAGEVLVEDGRILAVGPGLNATADRVIDAEGHYVLPGFIDFHVHVDDRIGAFELADTYESGSRIAAVNGITTLCSFVTQPQGESLIQSIRRARAKARGLSHGDILWHLTPTRFGAEDWADLQQLVGEGYRTFKFYTTYKTAGIFADEGQVDELFLRLGPLGARFLVHCEDDARMATVDLKGLDLGAPATHGRLRPEAAELLAVESLVDLATVRRVPLHVVHVSTSAAAEVLMQTRRNADITCETCPQYLWLDDTWLQRADGHRWLCSPPLRPGRERFRELAQRGAFDVFATDHCAFRQEDKDTWDRQDIRTVANGLAGLGALPHLVWKLWGDDPDRAALEMARRLSRNPAHRAGIGHRKGALQPGFDADLVVLDPSGPERTIASTQADAYETYPGFTSTLAFRHVLLRGEPVASDGRLLHPQTPTGHLLQPEP